MNPIVDPATLFLANAYTDQEIGSLKKSGGVGYERTWQTEVFSTTRVDDSFIVRHENMNQVVYSLPRHKVAVGKSYSIIVDGVDLHGTLKHLWDNYTYLGNPYLLDSTMPDTGEDWVYYHWSKEGVNNAYFLFKDKSEYERAHTFAMYENHIEHQDIHPKFLPEGIGCIEKGKLIGSGELEDGTLTTGSAGRVVSIPVDGQTYVVELRSGTYSAVCHANNLVWVLGNAHLFEPEQPDTGESFFVLGGRDGMGVIDANKGDYIVIREPDIFHKTDPRCLPNEVLDFDAYGVSVENLFLQGGGTMSVNLTEMFDSIVRGSTYICRGSLQGTIMDINPIYFQWSGDTLYSMGFTVSGVMNGNMATANYNITRGTMSCSVSFTPIPS